jgi:hypothetical protein
VLQSSMCLKTQRKLSNFVELRHGEVRRLTLPKLFGKSERVPNRVPEGVQEGTNKTRSAASWRQRPTLEKPLAIFQHVSLGSTVNRGKKKGESYYA